MLDTALEIDSKCAVSGNFQRQMGYIGAGFFHCRSGCLDVVRQPTGARHPLFCLVHEDK